MATKLAKGKAKVGYVLNEKLIEKIKHRAVTRKMHASHLAERLLLIGLKHEFQEETCEPEAAAAS